MLPKVSCPLAAFISLCLVTSIVTATVSTSTTAPNSELIASSPTGTVDTGLFDEDTNANHARGQLFTLPDGSGEAYQIDAITLFKSGTQTYFNDTLTLRIFEGTEAQWNSGTGHSTAIDSSNYYVGTTVTPIHTEAFDLNSTITNNHYVTLTLATPIIVNEDSEFGFLLTYDQGSGTQGDFRHREAGAGGGRISITTTNHGTSSSRRVHFYVQGSAITPQGSVASSLTAPATNILSSSIGGTTDTALFDEVSNTNHARGQLFTLPDGIGEGFEITAVTIRKSTVQTYLNDTLTLRFFEGTEAEWVSGSGHETSIDGDDFYQDTTVTSLYTETFTLNGTYADDDYITFELAQPLSVNEDSDFGFFMTYDQVGGTEDRFRHREAISGGGRISVSTGGHFNSQTRQVHYFIQGIATGLPQPTLVLGSPFQDRVVLQRDKPVNIWGTSNAGSAISVSINGLTVSGTADAEGDWMVTLPSSAAGGPYQLGVTSSGGVGAASVEVDDVLFGDVWFCFGQSNMRWTLNNTGASGWAQNYVSAIGANDNIRCLSVIENGALDEREETEMSWLANSTAGTWTAVGSVFAHQLNAATSVPVGIIYCAYGSSSIEGWLPNSLTTELPHFREMLSNYQSIGEYRDGVLLATRLTDGRIPGNFPSNEEAIASLTASSLSAGSNQDIFIRKRPNILYNRRVHPLRNFGISGFIWYQGEANAGNTLEAAQYRVTLPLMVKEYRERFGQGDLPFFGVQLPSYQTAAWPWFREAQDALLVLPNAHVAITIDTGNTTNIHPSDKEEIGARLVMLAREHVLGEAVEGDSPRYASHSISGNQVTLTFDHASGLRTTDNSSPAGFEVAGADQVFHNATSASISGNTITLSSTAEPNPVAVRYAWTPTTHTYVNVINNAAPPVGASGLSLGEGLPLAPFRTDDWPLAGLGAQLPFGVVDEYSVARDTTLSVPVNGVLANDFDLNFDALEAVLVSTTSNGILNLQLDGSFTYVPEEGFTGSDSFRYRVKEVGGSFATSDQLVTITVVGTPSVYYSWRTTIGWAEGDAAISTGDPDGDGILNLMEYALAADPLIADRAPIPTLTLNGDETVNFSFNNAREGISYVIEVSDDLDGWEPHAILSNESLMPVTIPYSVIDPSALAGGGFIRLRVFETEE